VLKAGSLPLTFGFGTLDNDVDGAAPYLAIKDPSRKNRGPIGLQGGNDLAMLFRSSCATTQVVKTDAGNSRWVASGTRKTTGEVGVRGRPISGRSLRLGERQTACPFAAAWGSMALENGNVVG